MNQIIQTYHTENMTGKGLSMQVQRNKYHMTSQNQKGNMQQQLPMWIPIYIMIKSLVELLQLVCTL